jgi:preprotein translocase subunit SecG
MSNTTFLLISIGVFCLLILGLILMVREFMGDLSAAFPEIAEWLNSSNEKK